MNVDYTKFDQKNHVDGGIRLSVQNGEVASQTPSLLNILLFFFSKILLHNLFCIFTNKGVLITSLLPRPKMYLGEKIAKLLLPNLQ